MLLWNEVTWNPLDWKRGWNNTSSVTEAFGANSDDVTVWQLTVVHGSDMGVHVLREPNYSRQVADGPSTFEGTPWLNTTCSLWASTQRARKETDGGRQAQPAATDFTSMVVQLRARARTDMVFAAILNFTSSNLTCQ